MPLTSQPLSPRTWPAFARLVEKHNGIFGGCWCISFHLGPGENKRAPAEYRAMKERRVLEGRAHAALVFDGDDAVGWCQFGSTEELPNIRSRKAYEEGLRSLPDWRITCFFIDRKRRGEGIANLALREALQEIGRLGGGVVEAYPEDVADRKVSRSFLCSGTLGMFEKEGFERGRKIAMHRWVVARKVAGAAVPSVPTTSAAPSRGGGSVRASPPRRRATGSPRPPRARAGSPRRRPRAR
ncbi:MAG TPA: GNAT family N-acetyltransferase [Thermoplasmata archaeon]|nr:GNAT family N-acetyltransferase [Thermoplasmata archaeon]